MATIAAILSSITSLWGELRRLLFKLWKDDGERIAKETQNAETDADREKAADSIVKHINDLK